MPLPALGGGGGGGGSRLRHSLPGPLQAAPRLGDAKDGVGGPTLTLDGIK